MWASREPRFGRCGVPPRNFEKHGALARGGNCHTRISSDSFIEGATLHSYYARGDDLPKLKRALTARGPHTTLPILTRLKPLIVPELVHIWGSV
jgi:hypothetical protein